MKRVVTALVLGLLCVRAREIHVVGGVEASSGSCGGVAAGDVECPFGTITSALVAATTPGDRVLVHGHSNYFYTEDIDLSLPGHSGPFAVLGVGGGPAVSITGSIISSNTAKIANVSVSNFAFVGPGPQIDLALTAVEGLRVEDCSFCGGVNGKIAVTTIDGTGIVFSRCVFEASAEGGNETATLLHVSCATAPAGGSGVMFESCSALGSGFAANARIVVDCAAPLRLLRSRTSEGGGFVVRNSVGCIVRGCEFDGVGVVLDSVSSCTVADNAFFGTQDEDAVMLLLTASDGKSITDVHMVNNSFRDVLGVAAVRLANSSGSSDNAKKRRVEMIASGISLSRNDFSGIGTSEYAVLNSHPEVVTIDAVGNFWGDESGPEHACNPTGNGPRVSEGVNFWEWCSSAQCDEVVDGVDVCAEAATRPKLWVVLVVVFGTLVGIAVIAGLLWLLSSCARIKSQPYLKSAELEDAPLTSQRAETRQVTAIPAVATAAAITIATATPAIAQPAVAITVTPARSQPTSGRTSEDDPRSTLEPKPTRVIELATLSPSRSRMLQLPGAATAGSSKPIAPIVPTLAAATTTASQPQTPVLSTSSSFSSRPVDGEDDDDSQQPSVHSSQMESDKEGDPRKQRSLEAAASSRSFSGDEVAVSPVPGTPASTDAVAAVPLHHFRRTAAHVGDSTSPSNVRTPRTPSANSSTHSLPGAGASSGQPQRMSQLLQLQRDMQEAALRAAAATFDGSESSEFGDLQ